MLLATYLLRMRSSLIAALALALVPATLQAQQLTRADSNLVYAILTAEDRRDSTAPALAEGIAHGDARIRVIAERAKGRIADSTFAARASLPAPAPRVTWPLPAWRARHDSLRTRRGDCGALALALDDRVLQVRLRAADLLPAACADSAGLVRLLSKRIDQIPDPTDRALGPLWHDGAHALVALARLHPELAAPRVARLARHRRWQVRMYTARAAQLSADTALLRQLTRDANGNVVEAAVEALRALGGHGEDAYFLQVLRSARPQAVRVAAVALKGSPRSDLAAAATAAWRRWRDRRHDSERDVRLALLELMGRPATDDIAPRPAESLPREVIALALGAPADLTIQVGRTLEDTFVVRLRGDAAPITAARVLQLADRGRYNGTSWHRVISDFVIQGGSPDANEYVGGGHFFRDELGPLSHLRGGVGMSTRGHDTGDGQWFIDLTDVPRLDRDYTIFGEVIAGMTIVDGVLEGDEIASITRSGRPRPIR